MDTIEFNPSTIYIVGNGFDLNLGLKTSYKHFLASDLFKSAIEVNNICQSLNTFANLTNWIDIENVLKLIAGNFDNNFEEDFEHLSLLLMEYLNSLDYNKINRASLAYKLVERASKENFLILNFNYTDTINQILAELGYPTQEYKFRNIQLHGKIKERNIIFGVEDSADISPTHIFLKKSFNRNFHGIDFTKALKNAKKITFFGHSLGLTDHMYFKDFIQDLSNSSGPDNKCQIDLYFYDKAAYKSLLTELDVLSHKRLSNLRKNCILNLLPCDN